MYKCTYCGEDKPSTEFYTELRKTNAVTPRCKDCTKGRNTDARGSPRIRASLLMGGAKSRAIKKGIPFDLDLEWVVSKIEPLVCEATGVKLTLDAPPARGHFNLWSPSLDKIDPHGGYTKDNVAVVATGYNLLKNQNTNEDAMRFLSEVATKT